MNRRFPLAVAAAGLLWTAAAMAAHFNATTYLDPHAGAAGVIVQWQIGAPHCGGLEFGKSPLTYTRLICESTPPPPHGGIGTAKTEVR